MNRDKALDKIVRTLTEERGSIDDESIRGMYLALYGTNLRIDDDDAPLNHEQAVRVAMRGWTQDDQQEALAEGWAIFDTGDRLEIERDDEAALFPNDDAASEYVTEHAHENALHNKALNVINTYAVLTGLR